MPERHAYLPVMQETMTEKIAGVLTPFGGYLECQECGHQRVLGDVTFHLTVGWPRCCNLTMRWWTQRQIDAGECLPPRDQP